MAALAACVVLLLAAVAPAFGKDYVVGDSSGWTSGVDYDTWAKGKTFNVGDNLVFQYNMMHTVAEVSSADYSACSASNSIQSYSDQNTKIALTKPGTRYFVCGTPGHCSGGMKLAVTVAAADATAPAPESPSAATPAAPGTETPPEEATPVATNAPAAGSTSGSAGAENNRLVVGLAAAAAVIVGVALI
ncbi:hypothetical protein PR202_ga02171 [Eleusine coracana subsp. coracana]|uniref:Phytocyanin domain-containing protein n=1 Tax=Eleusine coracana subsp. coracana TaxID=191504 RepID=A0AAV5BK10_ELECO|nr:hypothetical protein QOZ80_2AG0139450 [Eleusine coracana subsp. coracana]GJM86321.1 hypothetical protein PR202_ga02171 [Eleusine coracana subsp. coracana]